MSNFAPERYPRRRRPTNRNGPAGTAPNAPGPRRTNAPLPPGQTPPIGPPGGVGGGQAPAGGTGLPPWAADPILVQAQAAYQKQLADAEASALAQRQQLLVGYGDPNLANSLLGEGNPYSQAAEQNPFSVLSNLRHGYEQEQTGLNEGLNRANLFYSSTRGNQLGELARGYQGQQAQAAGDIQSQLGGITSALLGSRQQGEQDLMGAQEGAYGRWLEQMLTSGATPVGTPNVAQQLGRGQIRQQVLANHPGWSRMQVRRRVQRRMM
jgi:hypothetical protein